MKLISIFLLAFSMAHAAETITQPDTPYRPNQGGDLWLTVTGGNKVKASVSYTSDGNGNLTPMASRAQAVTIEGHLAPFSYAHLSGNGTSTVKSGAGVLGNVCVNNNDTGGSATIYDNTAGSGTVIGVINVGADSLSTVGPVCLDYHVSFSTGLTVVTAGSSSNDVTVTYK